MNQSSAVQMRDKIFISYRRSDSDAIARQLYDDLKTRYGAEQIFFDLVGNRIGFDFGQRIVNALNESAVVLTLIGPTWAASFRRGPDDTDWMRFEVANALTMDAGSRVIPVLAEARMPAPKDLPIEISQISTKQAVVLSRKANEWGPGVRVLYREIETRGIRRRPTWQSPKRIVRIQHHRHPFLSTPGETVEALVHVLGFWDYNILERNDIEGIVSFQWGANAHMSGKVVQWVYKRMREEGTYAVIERSPTGSVLDLSVPSARFVAAAGLMYAPVTIGATIAWERRVAKRFFNGVQRRLDGLDAGPDPLAFFDGKG